MLISWDRRMVMMQELGDVSFAVERPFQWRVRHADVFLDDGDDWLVPQGEDTNPYGAADDHWRQLVTANRVISLEIGAAVRWNVDHWQIIGPLDIELA